jgi:hypothetical protein
MLAAYPALTESVCLAASVAVIGALRNFFSRSLSRRLSLSLSLSLSRRRSRSLSLSLSRSLSLIHRHILRLRCCLNLNLNLRLCPYLRLLLILRHIRLLCRHRRPRIFYALSA